MENISPTKGLNNENTDPKASSHSVNRRCTRHHRRHHSRHSHSSKKKEEKSYDKRLNKRMKQKERNRRLTRVAKKMRGRSTMSQCSTSNDYVAACLAKARRLIQQHKKAEDTDFEDLAVISPDTPKHTSQNFMDKNENSPATVKKKIVAREIENYPEDLKALFTADTSDFFDSPARTTNKTILNDVYKQDDNSASNYAQSFDVGFTKNTNTISTTLSPLSREKTSSHQNVKENADQMLTEVWGAILRESAAVTSNLKSIMTDLETSEAEKVALQECLAQVKDDKKNICIQFKIY